MCIGASMIVSTIKSMGSTVQSSLPMLTSSIATSLNGVVAVLCAPACAACRRVLDAPFDGPVCAACWSGVQRVAHADAPSRDAIAAWQAAGEYDGALREIIHAFKYDGRRSLALPLAALIRQQGAELLQHADLVVPVPLHPWRRVRRGFNQADDLARHLGLPVCRALWRTRATAPQAKLDPAERRRNVRAAFRLSPFVRAARFHGAHVVLVDDVRTTGATLEACARVLKRAGAGHVSALTVARAT
jgi:ComF family protein